MIAEDRRDEKYLDRVLAEEHGDSTPPKKRGRYTKKYGSKKNNEVQEIAGLTDRMGDS